MRDSPSNIAVLIPALDEQASLPIVLAEIPPEWADVIVVIDNGSVDATAQVAARAGAHVVSEERRGYGAAMLRGLEELRHRWPQIEIVVFLDADYSDHPDRIGDLVRPILEGKVDFVLGSRVLGEREPGALTLHAYWGNRLACWLMRLLTGRRYTDLGPFRAIRREVLDRLGMRDRDFGWTIEMQLKAARAGVPTLEVPVPYRRRIGKSKISGTFLGSIRAGIKILYSIARYGSVLSHSRLLLALGLVQAAIYATIFCLSSQFQFSQDPERQAQRPILAVLLLFGIATGCYLASLIVISRWRSATRNVESQDRNSKPLWNIFLFAMLFRVPMWFSTPIQEIDIYRYIWDGQVLAAGISPYAHSPREVRKAVDSPETPENLRRLVRLSNSSDSVSTILGRVHYSQYPTVYPPVSQLVFAASVLCTPADASVGVHLWVIKGFLIFFDLGTILLLAAILARLHLPTGWVLAYAWCPLVIKEIGNSGHLDSIAVCLTMLTLWLLVRSAGPSSVRISRELGSASLAAILLATATLAKIYPIVTLPIVTRWWWRRLGVWCLVPLVVYGSILVAVYTSLMYPTNESRPPATQLLPGPPLPLVLDPENPSVSETKNSQSMSIPAEHHDPFEGLRVFFSHWEMNDLLFMVVVENLTPPPAGDRSASEYAGRARPWFAITPNSWRLELEQRMADVLDKEWMADVLEKLKLDAQKLDLPFLAAQLCLGLFYLLIMLWLVLRPWPGDDRRWLLRSVFFAIAWLWLLAPTQNPWYWIWALPLVVFVRGPWLLVSGFAFLYYLRFWFLYHFPDQTVWGTPYEPEEFFAFVVVWIEHFPLLVLLVMNRVLSRAVR